MKSAENNVIRKTLTLLLLLSMSAGVGAAEFLSLL